jgi:hypothetical protein
MKNDRLRDAWRPAQSMATLAVVMLCDCGRHALMYQNY